MEKSAALREYAKYLWKLAAEVEAEEGGPMGIGAHTGIGALGGAGLGVGAGLGALALASRGKLPGVAQRAFEGGSKGIGAMRDAIIRGGGAAEAGGAKRLADLVGPQNSPVEAGILNRILASVKGTANRAGNAAQTGLGNAQGAVGRGLRTVGGNDQAMYGLAGGLGGAGLGGLAGLGTGIARNYGE